MSHSQASQSKAAAVIDPIQTLPLVIQWLIHLRDYLGDRFGPGPQCIKKCVAVNLQKGGTLFFVLGLMYYFDNWSVEAYTYAALHGSYGFIWLLKEAIFPDPNWQKKVTICSAVNSWLVVLGWYWLAPWLLISSSSTSSPPLRLGIAVFIYSLGVVIMMGSDCQKFFTLKERRGLITNGFFKYIRNPNYLGEMMIYSSFALVAGNFWQPWLVLVWVWLALFLPNIASKEASMARYGEWAGYKKGTWCLVPGIF